MDTFTLLFREKCCFNNVYLWFGQVFLSLLDTPVCVQEQESLDEALSQVNSDIDSLPMLTDFPIGTLNVMSNHNLHVY